jgi:hypothetical protein
MISEYMTKTIEENFDEGFLGTKRKVREYVKPTGIWVPSFWDTPESIARKEAERLQRFINNFRNELLDAEERTGEAEKANQET